MLRMMDFFTLFWRRSDRTAWLLAFALAAFPAFAAQPHGIEVSRATVLTADDNYLLEADIDVVLSAPLEDALHKGIPLYSLLEFELVRSRWYW